MKNDYGNLRRRTRDSSWQWLMMGAILGVGVAMVACVGGYALGAITFPALESDTSTPRIEVEPNQTEVAAALTLTSPAATESQGSPATEDMQAASEMPPDETVSAAPEVITPLPTSLPGSAETLSTDGQPLAQDQTPQADTAAQQPSPTQGSANAAVPAGQETPIVGTPPVGAPSPTVPFTNAPAIPPELDQVKTELATVSGGIFTMGTTIDEARQAVDECALYELTNCQIDWMADSTPTHEVMVDTFQMEIYEVNLNQYVTFLNWMGPDSHKNGCQGQTCALTTAEEPNSYIEYKDGAYSVKTPQFYSNNPAVYVTWWGAEAYCRALNRRLPTEAEWEHAARGVQNNIYPWGFAFDVNLANSSRPKIEGDGPEPVNSYPLGKSPYGMLNMAGNVSEWVQDWYQLDYYSQQAQSASPQANPQGPVGGTEKVHRGGSWDTAPLFLRSVHRLSADPGIPTAAIGFRCVSEQPGASTPTTGTGATTSQGQPTPGGAPTLPGAATLQPTFTPAGPTATLDPG